MYSKHIVIHFWNNQICVTSNIAITIIITIITTTPTPPCL